MTTVVPGVPSLPIDVAIPCEGGHPNELVLEDGFILFMDTSAILMKIADVLTTNVPFERFDYFLVGEQGVYAISSATERDFPRVYLPLLLLG